jgi:hypothetical protein
MTYPRLSVLFASTLAVLVLTRFALAGELPRRDLAGAEALPKPADVRALAIYPTRMASDRCGCRCG